jgi:hypothetical protein
MSLDLVPAAYNSDLKGLQAGKYPVVMRYTAQTRHFSDTQRPDTFIKSNFLSFSVEFVTDLTLFGETFATHVTAVTS